jgi:6-pyruvoyltetrahydropterin/6-carboxytetrahydropterin synthase
MSTPQRTMTIGKEFRFEAAHSLPHLPVGHKCREQHGHSYLIKVYVTGPVDPALGWVTDYADIAKAAEPLVNLLDHTNVNRLVDPSTAEGIAAYLWDRLVKDLPHLSAVEVYETATTCVRYEGE